jgi:SAM-dependent methyltransferase
MSGSNRLQGNFDPQPAVEASDDPLTRLLDALAGDLLLRYVPGRRVLDLGYGSPEVTSWIRRRTGRHLSIVERGLLEPSDLKIDLQEYASESFDVVYCLRTFPHLGRSAQDSEALARSLLNEAARVTRSGGVVAVELANPWSLRGLRAGIRQPMTIVLPRKLVEGGEDRLTRYETVARARELLPPTLRTSSVHGLGVFTPSRHALALPLAGRLLQSLDWWARDRALLQHFGAHLLVLFRRG